MHRYRVLLFALLVWAAPAAEKYQRPPQAILDVLHAPRTPAVTISPGRDYAVLVTSVAYPPIADVAQPILRLAGLRINPVTNALHNPAYTTKLVLKRISDGAETVVALPPGGRPGSPLWSPDGKRFAFVNFVAGGAELWWTEAAAPKPRRVEGVRLNTVFGTHLSWLPDSRTVRVSLIPAGRGKPPGDPVPAGPAVQESHGRTARTRTFEDLLSSPHDEDLFDYYATSQQALVELAAARVTRLGAPALYSAALPSPDGKLLLIQRVHRPYSYLHTARYFPHDVEVWDLAGKLVRKVASVPLGEPEGDDEEASGKRQFRWHPNQPATVVWLESARQSKKGAPRLPYRDRAFLMPAPFTGEPVEIARSASNLQSLQFVESSETFVVNESDRARRWSRILVGDTKQSGALREFVSRDSRDAYKDPGTFVTRTQDDGRPAILRHGNAVYLLARGASAEGERPALDRLDLKTLKTERLFQSAPDAYERPVALLAPDASRFVTSRESSAEPLNYYVRTAGQAEARALTAFKDPTPQLRAIRKQRVTYKRADGVALSFTLYLPPGYKEGTRLPTVVWAYPREYSDASTAGQITGSTERFTTFTGFSHLFLTLAGYAVLDGATMPVVGDPKLVNDTYIDQIVSSAKAAIDKAAEMGVTDRDRVGVGGHSYGAFMTANLLAHSRLFKAGVARSGAYNRTLTPFGFQSERRTIWQAADTYVKMSPFMFADKIKDPILLIHGEADDNSGTFPIQSDRMYQAIRGNAGHVRLVFLPAEAHAYRARESVEHVLWEMITWFDRYLKGTPAKETPAAQ
jgi:dipeptidyl aminopeptidase/acylaminoacyl peptidase